MLIFSKVKWNGAIKRLTSRTNEVKQIVQDLIEMGCDHFLTSGDTVYLTTAMAQCVGTKALPNAQVQAYIERVANVEWIVTKNKSGTTKRFKKVTDSEGNKVDADVDKLYLQETKWFNHAPELNPDKPHTDVDKFLQQIKGMISKAATAKTEERIDGDVEAFDTLVEKLKELV